jgi:hypothetical protein
MHKRWLGKIWREHLDQEILWYITNACAIMHNMIIDNECGQDLDYSFYDLMGQPVFHYLILTHEVPTFDPKLSSELLP